MFYQVLVIQVSILGQIITSAVSFMFDEELAYKLIGGWAYVMSGLVCVR